MRSKGLNRVLLGALLVLGIGASPQGVRQAERWQREADLARTFGQWDVAYDRCFKLAEIFPGTPHGRLALRMAHHMQDWGLSPHRSPASDDPVSWTCEALDLVTWP